MALLNRRQVFSILKRLTDMVVLNICLPVKSFEKSETIFSSPDLQPIRASISSVSVLRYFEGLVLGWSYFLPRKISHLYVELFCQSFVD